MKKHGKIKTKLFAATIPIIVIAIAAISTANIWTLLSIHSDYKRLTEDKAFAIATSLRKVVNKNLSVFPLDNFFGMNAYLNGIVNSTQDISYCFIADTGKLVLYHSEEQKAGQKLPEENYDEIEKIVDVSKITSSIGSYYELIIPILTSDKLEGTIHIGIKKALIKKKIRGMIIVTFAVLITSLSISIPLIYILLQRYIIEPMAQLAKKAHDISSTRDLTKRIEIYRDDEIGIYSESFNMMIESLKNYYDELSHTKNNLENLNKTLEVKVNKRTKELKEKNRLLEKEINDRKHIEAELITANEKAKSANKAKSKFLAIMSHEIRTPMNGVIGMTNLILKTDLTDRQLDFVRTIQQSANSLLQIINDVLDFSKIEAGKLEIEPIDFHLWDLIEEFSEMIGIKAFEKNIDFCCPIDQDVPGFVTGDPNRLRQILINLGTNAIKFTEKGEVVVSVFLENECNESVTILFNIADTGIGIPKDQVENLFKPFSQAEVSTSRKFGGTGLGLAISRQLVDMMDGEIGVETIEGEGSIFWFTVKVKKQPKLSPISLELPDDISGRNVLIVDTQRASQKMLYDLLELWGLNCTSAHCSKSALNIIRESENTPFAFDLVIIDYNMSNLSGIELAKLIRDEKKFSHIKILLLFQSTEQKATESLEMSYVDGSASKPIRRHQIHQCIIEVLSNKAPALSRLPSEGLDGAKDSFDGFMNKAVRLLLVEDNPTNQKLTMHILNHFGYDADIANNGLEAIEAVKKRLYRVILMDVQMPEMDGLQATRLIRKNESKKGIRHESSQGKTAIIAVTANAMKGDKEKCLNAGMDDYISKPFDPEDLIEKIKFWTQQNSFS